MFAETFQNYCGISDRFDSKSMRVDAFVESAIREFNINKEEAELKVLVESGTEDDMIYYYEEANDGAVSKIKKAITAIIEAFKEFCSNLKSKVVRLICNAQSKTTLQKLKKKVKLNPFLAKKKVKVIDKTKPLKLIAAYKSKADKHIAKAKGGVFTEKEITSIHQEKEKYESDYKAMLSTGAALMTITVGKLLVDIESEYGKLPGHIDKIDKETSAILKNLLPTLDKEERAVAKAAYTTCANFRAKLAKDEANEHVDAIMHKISVLKKEVLKVKDKTQVDYEESAFDDDDDFDLFDGIMESTEDDIFAEAMTDADDLLADLDEIIL